METVWIYGIEEVYRDRDNYDAYRLDEDKMYATQALAQAECDRRNEAINAPRQAQWEKEAAAIERLNQQTQAEHDALVAAGLRTGGCVLRSTSPFRPVKTWVTTALELVSE